MQTDIRCPYDDCPFQGSHDEVGSHVSYMVSVEDPDHAPEKYVG